MSILQYISAQGVNKVLWEFREKQEYPWRWEEERREKDDLGVNHLLSIYYTLVMVLDRWLVTVTLNSPSRLVKCRR